MYHSIQKTFALLTVLALIALIGVSIKYWWAHKDARANERLFAALMKEGAPQRLREFGASEEQIEHVCSARDVKEGGQRLFHLLKALKVVLRPE